MKLTRNKLRKAVSGSNKCAPNANAQRTEEGDVSFTKQILEISCVRARSCNGENIGSRKPCDALCDTYISSNKGQRATGEVKDDLRSYLVLDNGPQM